MVDAIVSSAIGAEFNRTSATPGRQFDAHGSLQIKRNHEDRLAPTAALRLCRFAPAGDNLNACAESLNAYHGEQTRDAASMSISIATFEEPLSEEMAAVAAGEVELPSVMSTGWR